MIVGAESAIGTALSSELRQARWPVLTTSRRADAAAGTLTLDISKPLPDLLQIPQVRALFDAGPVCAFVLAAVTSYQRCEDDPEGSRRVNVEGVVRVAEQLIAAGAFVVFPSSTAVFGEVSGRPAEAAATAPTTEYGRQKVEAEQKVLLLDREGTAAAGGVVARLTKVVTPRGLIGQWIQQLSRGSAIEAASDLALSPISARWAARALMRLAAARRGGGRYHIAGDVVCSYYEFARSIAEAIGTDPALVRPAGLRVPGRGAAGLTMGDASLGAGLVPQPLDSVVRDLIADAGA